MDEQMQVVRHEAVRQNCEAFRIGGAQNLPQCSLDAICADKEATPAVRAERQEIAMGTLVVESSQSAWRARAHDTPPGKERTLRSG